MTLRIPAKVLIHVWSYDFYDMTLSTGKQRRHMISMALSKKVFCIYFSIMANGWEGWLKDAEGQNLADAVLKTASSSLFVIQ